MLLVHLQNKSCHGWRASKDIKHCVLLFYIVIQVNFTLPTGHVTFLLILNVGQWVLFAAVTLSLHLTRNFICQLPKILQIFEAAQYFAYMVHNCIQVGRRRRNDHIILPGRNLHSNIVLYVNIWVNTVEGETRELYLEVASGFEFKLLLCVYGARVGSL